MREELLINATSYENRVALLEGGVLQEIMIERVHGKGLVGNLYKGKVVRVLPGMQAVFVDIGLEKAAFLHISDMGVADQTQPISTYLDDGQAIVVQVIKDQLGNKGARLTMQLSLPSRYLVYMPEVDHIGVSQRIAQNEERERLKSLLQACLQDTAHAGGYIIRTVAEGILDLQDDKQYLDRLWEVIQEKSRDARCGTLIHQDLSLPLRALRDFVKPNTERVYIDNEACYLQVLEFVKTFMPDMESKLEWYTGPRPIFDRYGVEDEIQKALMRKVPLKSGGSVVFDQTEAMATIDVNTGGFVGHRNADDTIFRTNLEAAHTIARQVRLRNLGGIIIIDFIDMVDEEHRRQVLRALEKSLAHDGTKNNVSEISALGLVQMTRKRTRESLEHVLCETCEVCDGRGTVKSTETVCHEIFREIVRVGSVSDSNTLLVLASQAVVERLLDEESQIVAELEQNVRKMIKFQVETLYNQEQYDVVIF